MKTSILITTLAVPSFVLASMIACSSNDPGTVINNSSSSGASSGATSSGGTSSSGSSSGGTSSSSSSSSSGGTSLSGSSSGTASSSSGSSSGSSGGDAGGGGYGTACTTAGTTDPACTGTYDVCASDQGALICTKACTYPAGSTGPVADPTDCPDPPTTGDCTPNSFCK